MCALARALEKTVEIIWKMKERNLLELYNFLLIERFFHAEIFNQTFLKVFNLAAKYLGTYWKTYPKKGFSEKILKSFDSYFDQSFLLSIFLSWIPEFEILHRLIWE